MEEVRCTACHAVIHDSDINTGQGFALCRPCGILAPLDTFINGRRDEPIHRTLGRISRLPKPNTWLSNSGDTTTIGARAQQTAVKAIVLAFAIMFSLPSLILLVATVLTLLTVTGITPDGYMPQSVDDQGNTTPSDASVLWLLAPGAVVFTLADVLLWIVAFYFIVSQFEVRFSRTQGEIVVGKGRFAKRHQFDPRTVYAVADRITVHRGGENGPTETRSAVLETTRGPLEFGVGLNEHTLPWMIAVLRDQLITQIPVSERVPHPSPRCPRCRTGVAIDSMNIAEGVALCGSCKQMFKIESLDLSGIAERAANIDELPPPHQCRIRHTELGTLLSAQQLRKWALARWVIPVLLFIFTIPFASHAVFAIAGHAGWIDASAIPSVSTNGGPSHPMTIKETFLWSAATVLFFGFALFMASKAFVATLGATTMLISQGKATLREGISKFATPHEIDLASIRSVQVLKHPTGSSDDDMSVCIKTSSDSVRVGRNLERDQQEWLATQLVRHMTTQIP